MGLRYNVRGLLRNAADDLEKLSQSRHPFAGGTAFALRELAENLARLAANPSLWSEFAEIYSLTPADLEGSPQ